MSKCVTFWWVHTKHVICLYLFIIVTLYRPITTHRANKYVVELCVMECLEMEASPVPIKPCTLEHILVHITHISVTRCHTQIYWTRYEPRFSYMCDLLLTHFLTYVNNNTRKLMFLREVTKSQILQVVLKWSLKMLWHCFLLLFLVLRIRDLIGWKYVDL